MGFEFGGSIITLIIKFVAGYLIFTIGRWFVLPSLGFQHHFADNMIIINLWRILIFLVNKIFSYIVAGLFVIYIVWWVIKTFIPEWILFIPLRMIFLAIPPFPPLTDAGILPLYDNLINVATSNDNFGTRIIKFIKALAGFLMQGTGWITGGFPKRMSEEGQATRPNDAKEKPKSKKPLSANSADELQIQNDYLQCLEENMDNTDPSSMNWQEKIQTQIKNNQTNMQCKLQSLNTLSNILSFKM